MHRDIEKMVVAEKRDEVELDETLYTEKMTVKELPAGMQREAATVQWEQKGDCLIV